MVEPEKPSASEDAPLMRLPFPPVTKQHILNCSFHAWHPRYRKITPKARLIPLSRPFLNYLRADGIILPPDEEASRRDWSDDDSGIFSSTENPDEDDDDDDDPSREWPEIHNAIRDIIAELGGKVCPKLNWSSPKDATWINATNTMDCRTPGDIYMMLKSSDFITHDLEQAFADTEDAPAVEGDRKITSESEVPYHLVLRKFFMINPSVEFRCFVRNRRLLAITQRDPNHYEFLSPMVDQLRKVINSLFEDHLRDGFPDPNFAFDVYIPPKYDKAWLIDINPWAQRTDPLLFSWLELLTMDGPEHLEETMRKEKEEEEKEGFVRLQLRPADPKPPAAQPESAAAPADDDEEDDDDDDAKTATPDSDDEADEEIWIPELRLVKRDDPEAYSFASPAYSAHKLPKDVVDASNAGEGGMREFAEKWKEILAREQEADRNYSSSEDDA